MKDRTEDDADGRFFGLASPVAMREEPAAAGNVLVCTVYRAVPTFLGVEGSVDAFAAREPVYGAEEGSDADEEVGRHHVSGSRNRGGKPRFLPLEDNEIIIGTRGQQAWSWDVAAVVEEKKDRFNDAAKHALNL